MLSIAIGFTCNKQSSLFLFLFILTANSISKGHPIKFSPCLINSFKISFKGKELYLIIDENVKILGP